jgi:hypothetical protein
MNRFDGIVAIFYNPITQVDPREWNSIREFNGPYHPLAGEYRCDDPAVLRRQLHWIRRAGVDVIVYDVYGFRTWNITDLPKDRTLPLLINELSNQDNESRKLKLVIWLERWDSNPPLEDYRYGLEYVQRHLAHHDFYYRHHGKPLVLTYLNGENAVVDTVEKENTFFTTRRVRAGRTGDWSYIQGLPQTPHREWMPVSPGFDDYMERAYRDKYVNHKEIDLTAIWAHAPKVTGQRDDGRFLEKQMIEARKANPEILFISGWNDWQCSMQIEPAVEYGFQYVDLAAHLLGRDTETAPYRDE